MQDGVDLGGLHDPAQDRVGLVPPDELGSLEGDRGARGPDTQDDVDVGVGLKRLDHAPTPERVRTGDEDSPAHGQPNQTLRRSRSIS